MSFDDVLLVLFFLLIIFAFLWLLTGYYVRLLYRMEVNLLNEDYLKEENFQGKDVLSPNEIRRIFRGDR